MKEKKFLSILIICSILPLFKAYSDPYRIKSLSSRPFSNSYYNTPNNLRYLQDNSDTVSYYYDKYFGEETNNKYQVTRYVGMNQERGYEYTNYDTYYYTYSGERNSDYYVETDKSSQKEPFSVWIKEWWSHTTNRVISWVVGTIVSCICLILICVNIRCFYDNLESKSSKKYLEERELIKTKVKKVKG